MRSINLIVLIAPTLSLLDTGGISLCAEANSPIGGTLSIELVLFGLTVGMDCGDPHPADLAGTWSGDYLCRDWCIGEEPHDNSGIVTLVIEQDGFHASYHDSEAHYTGIVCGNTFTFVGGAGDPPGSEYAEFGRFTLNADGTGSKESTWRSGFCGGDCQDPALVRID